ncbi:unnamed protein product [Brachionus calyciflorus]|uniref:Uncharacterized protein n=1 Tax=Brachionus calyciflorus TaxID=104777 RepID=A0A813YR07_9BILA|nr:unnamed protein product [Brachionus calyciflorus]
MSLLEDLLLLKPKPYQPLYSGKINPIFKTAHLPAEKLRNNRPKTSVTISNVSPDLAPSPLRPFSSSNNLSTFRNSNAKAPVGTSSLAIQRAQNENDDSENESINISLLNVDSETNFDINNHRKEYGQFSYFSYFERYMNRIAKRKIPSYLLPRPPPELADKPELTLYEMLEEFELIEIYNLVDIRVARPFRLRSNSTGSNRKSRSMLTLSGKQKRRHSLECFLNRYLTHKLVLKSLESDFMNKKKESEKNSFKSFLIKEDSDLTNNNEMDIKPPEIYALGSMKLKNREEKLKNQNKNLSLLIDQKIEDPLKKKYSHIESKYSKYLSENSKRRGSNSHGNIIRSKSAIQQHYSSANKFILYKKPKSAYLKLSNQLDSKIREDIHRNKGPIYFGELKQDNLDIHNEYKTKLELKDKNLFIYEWLQKIDTGECKHFYRNPFKESVSINTETEIENQAETIGFQNKNQPIFLDKKRKIDPFENPKNQITKDRLPNRLNSAFVLNSYYETMDKQTLASKSDYLNSIKFNKQIMLRTDSNINSVKNIEQLTSQENYCFIRERLAKEKRLNDILLTRMKLDLFVL